MTEDATLSEFLSETADDGDDRDEPGDGENDAGKAVSDNQTGEVEPKTGTETPSPRSTYAVGDYTCKRCEEATDRVWRDDEVFVCPECKSW